MKLYIFNPEHDIALAANLANFTPPHAGRQLRADLGFLPALWADDGDAVVVDHVESAQKSWEKVARRIERAVPSSCLHGGNKLFVPCKQLVSTMQTTEIQPWGWDKALRAQLKRQGVPDALLPTDAQLESIRRLSHRRMTARLLPMLQMEGTIGEAFECISAAEVEALKVRFGQVVLKAPWSSSGRGLRFVTSSILVSEPPLNGWLNHLLQRQGSVMVEPIYNKVKDFGMEFYADGQGGIRYEGLSLFHTVNGAYVGNLLATEKVKVNIISRYVPEDLLHAIKQKIISSLKLEDYCGPFGVDMMIVRSEQGLLLHPCVEINLRRTMGHVALSISPTDDDIQRVMRVIYNGNNYQFKIHKL